MQLLTLSAVGCFAALGLQNAVHDPCEAPEDYVANNKNIADGQRRQFAAMINAVDDAFVKVVGALKKTGMFANTIM